MCCLRRFELELTIGNLQVVEADLVVPAAVREVVQEVVVELLVEDVVVERRVVRRQSS
jgi:hypothetical protein